MKEREESQVCQKEKKQVAHMNPYFRAESTSAVTLQARKKYCESFVIPLEKYSQPGILSLAKLPLEMKEREKYSQINKNWEYTFNKLVHQKH